VVQAKGRGGSAIFSLNGTSTSTAVGEAIGATGWRLHAAEADSVVIERNGQQQRVSIGGAP
jgi:type II secretory pathway component PulK